MPRTTLHDLFHRHNRCLCMKYGRSYLFKFPFSERIFIIGPHWPGVLTTFGVIGGGTIVNLRIIQKFGGLFTKELTIFAYIMTFLTISLLIATATTEPGIVFPPEAQAENDDNDLEGLITSDPLKRNQGRIYCETCHIYCTEEMKVGHCNDCGYCIEKLDHHCPWMGQCIGKRNMIWFIFFNASWFVYFVQFIALAVFSHS